MAKVVIDTCIWSDFMRKKKPDPIIQEKVSTLLRHLDAIIIGPVRQELLSGISDENKFLKVRKAIAEWPDSLLVTADYELAAEYANACRRKGIQGSPVDFLICAYAVRHGCEIFSVDKDFARYAQVLPVSMYQV